MPPGGNPAGYKSFWFQWQISRDQTSITAKKNKEKKGQVLEASGLICKHLSVPDGLMLLIVWPFVVKRRDYSSKKNPHSLYLFLFTCLVLLACLPVKLQGNGSVSWRFYCIWMSLITQGIHNNLLLVFSLSKRLCGGSAPPEWVVSPPFTRAQSGDSSLPTPTLDRWRVN